MRTAPSPGHRMMRFVVTHIQRRTDGDGGTAQVDAGFSTNRRRGTRHSTSKPRRAAMRFAAGAKPEQPHRGTAPPPSCQKPFMREAAPGDAGGGFCGSVGQSRPGPLDVVVGAPTGNTYRGNGKALAPFTHPRGPPMSQPPEQVQQRPTRSQGPAPCHSRCDTTRRTGYGQTPPGATSGP